MYVWVKLKVAEIVEEKKPNLKSFDVVQQGFVRRLEDLVLGPNPVLGGMKKNLYENVPHAFSVEVPVDWTVGAPKNLAVLLNFEDEDNRFKGRLSVEYRKRIVPLKEFASEYDSKEHRIVRQNLAYFSLPAVRTTHRYPKSGKNFVVSTYFVHGRHTYRFVFESKFSDKGILLDELDSFLKTVSFMTPEQVKKKGTSRLRLHVVKTNDTLAKIAAHYYPNNKDAVERFKSFNGMHNGSIKLRPGNVIKVPEISPNKKD